VETPHENHPHLQDADGFYEQLLDAHAGLSREQSELLNARLILLLANQVGDAQVLRKCLQAAALDKAPAKIRRYPTRQSSGPAGGAGVPPKITP
jgi:hypothetical protein